MRLRRTALRIAVGVLGIMLLGWPDILAFVNGARLSNVDLLYDARGALRPGTSRDSLNAMVSATKPPIRTLWRSRDELLLWVPVGFMESVYLQVFLTSDAVAHARIRGDGGDTMTGAPADF